jgi:hypothetical protein
MAESSVDQRVFVVNGAGRGFERLLPRPLSGHVARAVITETRTAVSAVMSTQAFAEFAQLADAVVEFTEGLKR